MPTFKCPECNEEIRRLYYSVEATAYGEYSLIDRINSQDEAEETGEPEYKCPECDAAINPSNIITINNPEEEQRQRDNNASQALMRQAQEVFSQRPAPREFSPQPQDRSSPDEDNLENDRPIAPAIDSNWRGEYSGYHNSHDTLKTSAILTCPKCRHKTEAETDETIKCQKCNTKFNYDTAKKRVDLTT